MFLTTNGFMLKQLDYALSISMRDSWLMQRPRTALTITRWKFRAYNLVVNCIDQTVPRDRTSKQAASFFMSHSRASKFKSISILSPNESTTHKWHSHSQCFTLRLQSLNQLKKITVPHESTAHCLSSDWSGTVLYTISYLVSRSTKFWS